MNTIEYPKKLNKKYQSRLAYKLNQLCESLDELENVNNGGCCYVAYCIADELFKNGYNNIQLIIYSDEPEHFSKLSDIKTSQTHYAIKFQEIIINEGGFKPEYVSSIPLKNSKSLKEHYNKFSWNEEYSKRKNSLIKKTIKNYFNDFISDLYEDQKWREVSLS